LASEDSGVPDAVTWCDLLEDPAGANKLHRAARRCLQALRLGRETTLPFPAAQKYFKPEFGVTHLTPGLRRFIDQGIAACPGLRSDDGYAHDLAAMSRFASGPEHPCGWVPFVCIVDDVPRGLVTFIAPMEDPRDNRIVFATMSEVLAYVTDGPEDELDALHD
jgi:hypothetical protein